MPESMYHQIHFAWAEPTLLGRSGPGPAASSLPESEQPVLRSWRDRLVPALTADYRSALPGKDPADYPETLWARAYPDGQAALVYRWPGDVRSAHAWAIVGPAYGLALPRVLSLHENPNTRPAQRRPPVPGWATMATLPVPEPWERTATPGAVRTRDRRAAETAVEDEPILVGAVAAALYRPDLPVHIALEPERADLWQAVQLRFLWGVHRALHDVLTPPRAIPAAGWSWSFSTYDPVLGTAEGQHLAFGPPVPGTPSPFLNPPAPDYRKTAEGLVTVLREEGGDALAAHLRERGVPDAPTFADRRALLRDWLDPRPRSTVGVPAGAADGVPASGRLPGGGDPASERTSGGGADAGTPLPDLPEAEEPGEEETGPQPLSERRPSPDRPGAEDAVPVPAAGTAAHVPGGQRSLRGITREGASGSPGGTGAPGRGDGSTDRTGGEGRAAHGSPHEDNEALWPETVPEPEPLPEDPAPDDSKDAPGPGPDPSGRPRIFGAPEPRGLREPRGPRVVRDAPEPGEDATGLQEEVAKAQDGEVPPVPSQDTFGTGGPVSSNKPTEPPPESLEPQEPPRPQDEWTVAASPVPPETPGRSDGVPEPSKGPDLTDGPEDRTPADAPPLPVVPGTGAGGVGATAGTGTAAEAPSDYAAETEPEPGEALGEEDSDNNWPTQYVDLPLSRLERWHSRHGPEGARVDVVDVRAAVRAERAELQRVREERDHYHAEVQELRREVARLERPWLEGPGEDGDASEASRSRRWPAPALVLILLAAFLATGLEAGARFGLGTTDLLGLLAARITGASWWPL
ncbi:MULTISPECIES: hypothetical protein [Nocardiopsis]|uniref:Uncharacterized protein n=1 Tax=Nocardiopsis sinuspersici TaxID=501010 RepID=A0A1V3BXZ1_9ACTN|nr:MULTISPECIES: hypothetical protein [Nocardiopsis]OOC53427.1 hypothetical protein NOSIN_06075 [Nocardiopsis sinuspersici]